MLAVLAVSLFAGRAQAAEGEGARFSAPRLTVVSGLEQLTVSWETVKDAVGYKIQWRTQAVIGDGEAEAPEFPAGDWESTEDDIAALTYVIPELDAGKTYEVRGFARDEYGDYSDASDADETTEDVFDLYTGIPAPGEVTGVTVTAGSAKLTVSWDKVAGATGGYIVEWKSGTEKYTEPSETGHMRYRLVAKSPDNPEPARYEYVIGSLSEDALSGDTEYTVRVTATNEPSIPTPANPADGGNGPSVEERATPAPAQVTGVMVTSDPKEPRTLTVGWEEIPGADAYKVEWKSETDNDYATDRQETTTETEITINEQENLHPGTLYTVRVYAANGDDTDPSDGGAGDPSVDTATKGTPRPDKAEILSVESQAAGELTITWEVVPGATGYVVGGVPTPPGPTAGTSITISEDLVPGTEYTVTVTATNKLTGRTPADDDGEPSKGEKGTTKPARPAAPTLRVATRELIVSVGETAGAKEYTVQWKPATQLLYDPDDQETMSERPTADNPYRITGLEGGTPYNVRVYASTGGVDGVASAEETETPSSPLANQVSGLEVTSGRKELEVKWDELAGATFEVKWWTGTTADQGYDDASDDNRGSASGIPGTGHRIGSLVAGTEYKVEVTATVAGNEGSAEFKTAWTKPDRVTFGTATDQGVSPGDPGTLTVGWEQVTTGTDVGGTDVTTYKVQYKTGSGAFKDFMKTDESPITVDDSPVTIPGLEGTEYTVQVIATNLGGDGDPSVQKTATPVPGPVTGVVVTAGPRELKVKWEKAPGATAYMVRWWEGGLGTSYDGTPTPDPRGSSSKMSTTEYKIDSLVKTPPSQP